jgi:hypothetical protein
MLETGWWRGKDGVGGFSYFKKGVTKQCFQEGETKLTLTTFFVLDLLVYIINFSYIVMTTRRNEGVKHEQIYRNDQFTLNRYTEMTSSHAQPGYINTLDGRLKLTLMMLG